MNLNHFAAIKFVKSAFISLLPDHRPRDMAYFVNQTPLAAAQIGVTQAVEPGRVVVMGQVGQLVTDDKLHHPPLGQEQQRVTQRDAATVV